MRPIHFIAFLIVVCGNIKTGFCQDFPAQKIWDQAPHNAFTDLIRFEDKFYCTFREGTGHVPGKSGIDGKIRIIASIDGTNWESVGLLKKKNYDLRDPKLSIESNGKLMVLMGGAFYEDDIVLNRLSHVSFLSNNGKKFSKPQPVRIDKELRSEGDWLWRVTWHEGTGYGVVYQTGGKVWKIFLVKTANGRDYEWITTFEVEGHPNEATARVMQDGEMVVFLRREEDDKMGMVGRSMPPYMDWTWNKLDIRLGGPDFVELPDGKLVFGTRVYSPGKPYTGLFTGDRNGNLREAIKFPSGGDTSYPGMQVHDGELWVSYYSSHEGKTAIYLARVPLDRF